MFFFHFPLLHTAFVGIKCLCAPTGGKYPLSARYVHDQSGRQQGFKIKCFTLEFLLNISTALMESVPHRWIPSTMNGPFQRENKCTLI